MAEALRAAAVVPAPAFGAVHEAPVPGEALAARYRLAERIGGLGWCPLWRAADEVLHRTVAVRVILADPAPEPVLAAVRAASRLTDPRLAQIFDIGDHDGAVFVVSEWAGPETIEDLLARGLPHPALAARITAEAASALAGAHAAGLPHLRLGPRAVRWDGRSGVKVTGLGVDAALRRAWPAQDQGGAPAAADTRALAGVLYALLTGCWPGEGPSALPQAPRTRGRLHPPGLVAPGVPASLSAIVCRALLPAPLSGAPIRAPAELAEALTRRSGGA